MSSSSCFHAWYQPNGTVQESPQIAENAFRTAAERFADLTARDQRNRVVLKNPTCLNDVLDVVIQTKAKYDCLHEETSRVTKWLRRFSTKIHHYSNIFDVLVQHHPEYVSLAWGAMKLLFTGVINHEKTVAVLAKALSEIAESLPRLELKSRLYHTCQIQDALEQLYSLILDFLSRAHTSYTEPKVMRVIHSITKPHELHYDDLLKEISDCSNRIEHLATAGSQAELRDAHNKIQNLQLIITKGQTDLQDAQLKIDNLGSVLDLVLSKVQSSDTALNGLISTIASFQSIQSSAMIDTNERLSDLQLSNILSATSQVPLDDPIKCLEYRLFFRKRQSLTAKPDVTTNRFWSSPRLEEWSSSQASSLVVIQGSYSSQHIIQGFCAGIIEQLNEAGTPVLWALRGAQTRQNFSICSIIDVLKYLTFQALRLDSSLHDENSMAWKCSQFQRATSSKQWIELFKNIVKGLRTTQLYLVIDYEIIDVSMKCDQGFNLILELKNSFLDLPNKLKVILVTSHPVSLEGIPSDDVISVRTMGRAGRKRRNKSMNRSNIVQQRKRTRF